NAPKFFLSLAIVGLLVMGTLATTDAHLSTITKANTAIGPKPAARAGSGFQSTFAQALIEVFELEGNTVDDSGPGLPDDWNTVNSLPITNNVASMIAHTGLLRDPAPLSIFSQAGSRDTNDISEWRHTNGNVSDRYDITNAYAAAYLAPTSNHLVFVFAAERLDNAGDAAISFWLFQNKVVAAADGTFVDGNGNPAHHAVGDILIQVGFSNGGGQSTVRVLKWVGGDTGSCTGFIDPKSNGN